MAKKKATTKKKSAASAGGGGAAARGGGRRSGGRSFGGPDPAGAAGKHLVIVESPTKAKTINRYLGNDYFVMASVGHVRDLPKSAPKGAKRADHPVPGVDLANDFEPSYEVLPDKKDTVSKLRKAAKLAEDVWFATDLDREGEAIAWHLAQALDIPTTRAKRVVFNAITKQEVDRAFGRPRAIEQHRVDAQQARRILDRIVGYQVSPLLWKKVAGGLSAGRVQSVATRLVVEREREIEAFIPEEYWKLTGYFTTKPNDAGKLGEAWRKFYFVEQDGQHVPPTVRDQNAWLSEHGLVKAELTEVGGKPFDATDRDAALRVAKALGYVVEQERTWDDPEQRGSAQHRVRYVGKLGTPPAFAIDRIEKKRTRSNPGPPFITSTMQQQASTRLGFNLQRTMRVAQQLYEGIDLKGARGQTGLITYMRTDSTHLSPEAIAAVRGYIGSEFGDRYLPEKPNAFKSSNKDAQEAHEAIRPTDVSITPSSVRSHLSDEQFKLYDLVWRRFVACQMSPAEFDATTVYIKAAAEGASALGALFKATGRKLIFDGHLRITGVPTDDVLLPDLEERQAVAPADLDPTQHFTAPPPRYTEASLQKKLEEEGIGRPSTYAAIITTIQDRKYVEPLNARDKRLRATDLGKVVTDKLVEAFPEIMDVGYTRKMESELDEIESADRDWRSTLHEFYDPFKLKLADALENMSHAKAETEPAPHTCPQCGSATVYRFGRNGKFLSCSTYPECKYAAPINAKGEPQQAELTDVLCPIDQEPMIRRTGRFGPFLASSNYPEVQFIVKLDPKKGHVVLPKTEPYTTDLTCTKCNERPYYLRDGKNGLWLSCSGFPKCRGRAGFNTIDEAKQAELREAWAKHAAEHPVHEIRTADGRVLTDDEPYIPRLLNGESEPAGSISDGGAADLDAA
jgi:DNA topoisomerase I